MATEFCRMQSPSAMTHQFSHCPGSVPFFLAWVCFAMFLLFLQFIGVSLLRLLFFGQVPSIDSRVTQVWFWGLHFFLYQLSSCVLFRFWDELQFEGARSVYSRECATVNSQNSYLWSIELISVCKLFLVYCVIHNTVLCIFFRACWIYMKATFCSVVTSEIVPGLFVRTWYIWAIWIDHHLVKF